MIIKPMEERTFALHRFADFENADGATFVFDPMLVEKYAEDISV